MHGPCGGNAGAVPRGGKAYGKGGYPSNRKMPLKGLRKGGYILVTYKEKKAPGLLEEKVLYEGTIIDKRVGCVNRESYVELENCIRLNEQGEIEAKEGTKKLFDAFIEECEEVEKVEHPLSAELKASTQPAAGVGGAPGMNSMEAMMMACMGMMPMNMNMGLGMMGMPMMGMMPMGMMMPMMGMPTGSMPSTAPSMGGGSCGSSSSSLPSAGLPNALGGGGPGGLPNPNAFFNMQQQGRAGTVTMPPAISSFGGCGGSASKPASSTTTTSSPGTIYAASTTAQASPKPGNRDRSRSRSRRK